MPTRNNFESTRLIAALLVIYGHSYALLGMPAPQWFGTYVQTLAVRIFFVVSGYLVCRSWIADPNIGRFILKRCLRIVPALIAVAALWALIIGPSLSNRSMGAYFNDQSLRLYFWNVLLAPYFALPGVFEQNPLHGVVNGSLWTLPFEAVMYAALPVYASGSPTLCRRLTLLSTLALAVGAAASYELIAPDQVLPVVYWSSIPNLLKFAPYFVVGAVVASFRLENALNLQVALSMALLLSIVFFDDARGWSVASMILVPYATLSFSLAERPVFSVLSSVPDLSYGLYLWAFPIQQTIIQWHGPSMSPLMLFITASAVSAVPAYLSSRFVERPFMALKPRRDPARWSGEAPATEAAALDHHPPEAARSERDSEARSSALARFLPAHRKR